MKRLALALAAAVLGTACGSNPPPAPGAVDFSWSFVRYKADGTAVTPDYTCTEAGVDNVLVSFAGGSAMQVPCSDSFGDGARFDGIAAGTQSVVLTGRRGTVQLFSSQGTVTVVSGVVTPLNPQILGIPDSLEVFATLFTPNGGVAYTSCTGAGVTGVTYTIADSIGTVVALGSIPCSSQLPGLALTGGTSGILDRDTYTIRMTARNPANSSQVWFDSATTAVSPTCSGHAFNHYGQDTAANNAEWNVPLYDITSNTPCP
jgi:hypothetical protein